MTIRSTPWRAAAAGAALCAGLSGGLTGCSQDAPTLTAPCAVIVDGTLSGGSFHVAQRLKETLPQFLLDNGCRQVAFVPLTYASQDSACTKPAVDISPASMGEDTDPKAVQTERREYAEQQAGQVLTCAQQEERQQAAVGGSDVLGAFTRAMTERPAGTGMYHVLVVSDLIQDTAAANLYSANLRTQASRSALITKLVFKGLIPNMGGAALEVTDRGRDLSEGSSKSDLTSVNFNNFWTQLFASRAAGGPQVSYG